MTDPHAHDTEPPTTPAQDEAASGEPAPGGTSQETPVPDPGEPGGPASTLRGRLQDLWRRHRTLFWLLHSAWALATGVVVIFLAHERYGFLPWVVVFLALTWASTMYFGRRSSTARAAAASATEGGGDPTPTLLDEVTSYLNRIMYQETLFFLLPFYAYSTVLGSVNMVFLALLGFLAVVSCLDLVFDRWLHASPVFALVFFGSVAFAGINLVLPLVVGWSPAVATPLAAMVSVAAGTALAQRGMRSAMAPRLRVGATAVVMLGVAWGRPDLIPPVPIRMEEVLLSPSIQRETLTPGRPLEGRVSAADVPQGLVALARVFAPSTLPAHVSMEWLRDGVTVRTSREIEVVAHQAGFRVWDALRPGDGGLAPGRYTVVLWTRGRRIFGTAKIRVE